MIHFKRINYYVLLPLWPFLALDFWHPHPCSSFQGPRAALRGLWPLEGRGFKPVGWADGETQSWNRWGFLLPGLIQTPSSPKSVAEVFGGVTTTIQRLNVSEAAVVRRTELMYERLWSIGQKWCPEAFSPHGLFVKHFWVSVLRLADGKPIVPGHFLKKLHKQRESQAKTMSGMSLLSSNGRKK